MTKQWLAKKINITWNRHVRAYLIISNVPKRHQPPSSNINNFLHRLTCFDALKNCLTRCTYKIKNFRWDQQRLFNIKIIYYRLICIMLPINNVCVMKLFFWFCDIQHTAIFIKIYWLDSVTITLVLVSDEFVVYATSMFCKKHCNVFLNSWEHFSFTLTLMNYIPCLGWKLYQLSSFSQKN